MQYRPQLGDRAPAQQSRTTCGSACLTLSRMMINPVFARWVTTGLGKDARDDAVADAGTSGERFAAYEKVVKHRTNGWSRPGGGLQLPWPAALGTPPWGAVHELEFGAADPDTDYRTHVVRLRTPAQLDALHRQLHASVAEGRPAILYVGDRWLPRHVVLVMPPTGTAELDVYEPGEGRVRDLTSQDLREHRLGLGGWDVPWFALLPTHPATPVR